MDLTKEKVNRQKMPWLMLASVYTTQYIGIAFITSAAVAILREQGVGLDKLALLNLAAIPLAGKVLYAPLIDRFRVGLNGQYRSWLILAQALMVSMLIVASQLSLMTNFSLLVVVLGIYVLSMSVQDVAVDGLTCKIFDENKRKFASSIQFSGNLFGNIIGGGLILMYYSYLQWDGALGILALLTFVSLLQLTLFSEPDLGHNSEQVTRETTGLFKDIVSFIKKERRWFAVLLVYPLGLTGGFALLNPMLVDGGWNLADIGFATKVYGSAIGLVSAALASLFIVWLGQRNALLTITIALAAALTFMLPVSLGQTDKLSVYFAITAYFAVFPALLVIIASMIMDKSAQKSRKATMFTLQFSLVSLMGFVYAAINMAAAKYFGYHMIICACIGFTLLVVLIAWKLLAKETLALATQA